MTGSFIVKRSGEVVPVDDDGVPIDVAGVGPDDFMEALDVLEDRAAIALSAFDELEARADSLLLLKESEIG